MIFNSACREKVLTTIISLIMIYLFCPLDWKNATHIKILKVLWSHFVSLEFSYLGICIVLQIVLSYTLYIYAIRLTLAELLKNGFLFPVIFV